MSVSDFTASDLPDAGRPQSGRKEKPVTNLKFQIENLGVIKTGEFIQKPLTIFCGPNNSGKTWVMYSLYHCHGCMTALAHKKRKEKAARLSSPNAWRLIMNNIIKILEQTIGNELKLKRDNRDWLISDTNVQVGSPHRHSMGFSLDVSDSKQKPHSIAVQMLPLFEPVAAISDSASYLCPE